MLKVIAIVSLAFSLIALPGCAKVLKPVPLKLGKTPDGPPDFKKGWEDGCESGLASESNSYYKTFYSFKQDPYMVNNSLYFGAWFDAFRYCRDYVDKWAFDELDAPGIIDPNQ